MFRYAPLPGVDPAAEAATAHAALAQLGGAITLLGALTRDQRRRLESRIRHCPAQFLAAFVTVAANHGGVLMGQSFDVDAARRTLAYCEAFGHVALDLETQARAIRDDVDQRFGELMDVALGMFGGMKRARNTPNGKELEADLQRLDQLRRALAPHRRSASASTDTSSPSSSAGATASNGASASPGSGPAPSTNGGAHVGSAPGPADHAAPAGATAPASNGASNGATNGAGTGAAH